MKRQDDKLKDLKSELTALDSTTQVVTAIDTKVEQPVKRCNTKVP